MGRQRPPASDAEMDVLKALWYCGPSTVRQVADFLRGRKRRWAYNTVLTLLRRLRTKGYVLANSRGSAHVFRPTLTQAELVRLRLRELEREICNDSPMLVVEALLSDRRLGVKGLKQVRLMVNKVRRRRLDAHRRTAS